MSKANPPTLAPRIWLLHLVLPGRYGRWFTALGVFGIGVAVYWFGGIFGRDSTQIPLEVKSAALFFCVILAYLIPTLHYVSERTERAIDALTDELRDVDLQSVVTAGTLRERVPRRSLSWQLGNLLASIAFWLVQSWFLAGGIGAMFNSLTRSIEAALMALGALPVWIVVTIAIHALVDNARLFRRLATVVPVDVLHTDALMAFGRMAVSAVLVVVGAQASFSIMFFGGVDSPWAWGPGLLATSAAMWYLLLGPVVPLRRRLRAAKSQALAGLDTQLRRTGGLAGAATDDNRRRISELLVIREELRRVPEWPFDMDLLARLGIYLIIVPLTWVGAALIENVVDLVLD